MKYFYPEFSSLACGTLFEKREHYKINTAGRDIHACAVLGLNI
jgi:hypothetical protein